MSPTASRRVAVPVAAFLVSLLATACGGIDASSAPEDATKEEFCFTWVKQATALEAMVRASLTGPERALPPEEEFVEHFHSWAEDMRAVGTPSDIPEDGRSGFELALEDAAGLDAEDVSPEALEALDLQDEWASLSGADFRSTRALNTYVQDTCFPLYRERGLL